MTRLHSKCLLAFILFSIIVTYSLLVKTSEAKEESWQKHFVKSESQIPYNKFRAFYFDERMPGILKHTEIVDRPAVSYNHDKFHGIMGDNFGACWVGNFLFNTTKKMTISVSGGRHELKILVDGENIYTEKSKKTEFEHTFSRGVHKIEVQYLSDYSSVNFMINIMDSFTKLESSAISSYLSFQKNPVVWYCGAYESGNFDHSVYVNLRKSNRPIILILSSYRPIVWKFVNAKTSNLRAIIISSHEPRSIINNVPNSILVFNVDSIPYVYELLPKNSSGSSRDSFKEVAIESQTMTGRKPEGFTGYYELLSVTIPEYPLDDSTYSVFGMSLKGYFEPDKKNSRSRIDRVFE